MYDVFEKEGLGKQVGMRWYYYNTFIHIANPQKSVILWFFCGTYVVVPMIANDRK